MKNEHDDSLLPPVSEDGFETLIPLNQALPQITGYRILGILGSGGMGTTWRAVQLSTNREVAIKMMATHILGSPKAQQRFEREIEFAARIEHPNIARVYDSGLQSGVFYYSMELIKGIPLDRYVKENHLAQKDILGIVKKVAEAIQYAHQQGIIHRDLKPSNILVTEDGNPHVLDFGLAKPLETDDHHATISIDGEITGTPAFMSPEQAAGKSRDIDVRTDIYSLGVILYYLLTDNFPHSMYGPRYEVIRRISEDEIIIPRTLNKTISRKLEVILLKALASDPEHRYSNLCDFVLDIDNYFSGKRLNARLVGHGFLWRIYRDKKSRINWVGGLLRTFVVLFIIMVFMLPSLMIVYYTTFDNENSKNVLPYIVAVYLFLAGIAGNPRFLSVIVLGLILLFLFWIKGFFPKKQKKKIKS